MVHYREIIEKIEQAVYPLAEKEKTRFVVYTNGEVGSFVRKYLKTIKDIEVVYTIDNLKYNGVDILSLKQAKEKNNEGIIFLICSNTPKYYHEIREEIYNVFDRKQIVDLFPEEQKLPSEEEILKILNGLELYIKGVENGSC